MQVVGQTFVKCIDRTSKAVYEGILDTVIDTDSDVLVMGISGYGQKVGRSAWSSDQIRLCPS